MRTLIALAALVAFGTTSAAAEERATTKQAEMLLHNAVTYLKKEGKEKAFAAFNNPKGPFTYRDLYIFVYDTKGLTYAHGGKKEMIGRNNFQLKDADGKLFVQEGIKVATEKGKGWAEYRWFNPASGKIEQKVSYVELVGDLVVGCGAYRN